MTDASLEQMPVFFGGGRESLFGVLAKPTTAPNGKVVVLLNAGAWIPSMNRNQLWLRVSEVLTGAGYHVFRFDYHGVGDSTGTLTAYLVGPEIGADLDGAMSYLHSIGLTDVILFGWCYGARLALHRATGDRSPSGLVLMSLPVVDSEAGARGSTAATDARKAFSFKVIRRFFDPRYRHMYLRIARGRWDALTTKLLRRFAPGKAADRSASKPFRRDLRGAVAAGMPMVIVNGDRDLFQTQFEASLRGEVGRVLDGHGDRAHLVTLPGEVHRLLDVELQQRVIASALEWVSRVDVDAEARPLAAPIGGKGR